MCIGRLIAAVTLARCTEHMLNVLGHVIDQNLALLRTPRLRPEGNAFDCSVTPSQQSEAVRL
jgi:hypothetical protein